MVKAKEEEVGRLLEQAKGNSLPKRVKKDLEENVENYRLLILKMAHKYVRNRVEYDDLVQEAMIGLILADRDFDPSRSDDFHTYAVTRIKSKMYEYCIGNDSPIYVPTHVAKAAAYVKQMNRLLEREPNLREEEVTNEEVIGVRFHRAEKKLSESSQKQLNDLKQKLENIARNSKNDYKKLASLALKSLSLVVSDEILAKYPKEGEQVDELVSNRELTDKLHDSLGEKRYLVLSLHSAGFSNREIADKLFAAGYSNKQGRAISRQAVKAILDETLAAIRKMRIFRSLRE